MLLVGYARAKRLSCAGDCVDLFAVVCLSDCVKMLCLMLILILACILLCIRSSLHSLVDLVLYQNTRGVSHSICACLLACSLAWVVPSICVFILHGVSHSIYAFGSSPILSMLACLLACLGCPLYLCIHLAWGCPTLSMLLGVLPCYLWWWFVCCCCCCYCCCWCC